MIIIDGVSVVIEKAGKYLMIQRAKEVPLPLKWTCVGGKIEAGETPELTAIREVREEVGLEIEIIEQLAMLKGDIVEKLYFLLAKWKDGEVEMEKKEIRDFGWLNPEDVLRLELLPATRKFFEEYLKH
ncbi:MAG: NUDIX domain-containing protein [Candidatus Aenigmarchaeota archaeon]|nr:NUDIX domain-containing protein [Candidatus Aenigmarchaeota archaeon]